MSLLLPRRRAATLARPRMLLQGLLCLLVLLASRGQGPRGWAQEAKLHDLKLVLSFKKLKKDEALPRGGLQLRPNLPQEVFVYVVNETGKAQPATVELVAGDRVILTAEVKEASSDRPTLVEWPSAAGTVPGKAPALEELTQPVAVRVKDRSGASRSVNLVIATASDYLKTPAMTFYPAPSKDVSNRLEVVVERKKEVPLSAQPSRVELDLRPEVIRNFIPGQEKKGVYSGVIGGESEAVVLDATDLRFAGAGVGYVHLKVDGVPALSFLSSSSPSGNPITAQPITQAMLATSLPRYSRPLAAPLDVTIESAGPISERSTIKLELLASAKDNTYAEVKSLQGPRQTRLQYGKVGPEGGLLFLPEVKDWTAKLDLSGVHGTTKVRLRLLDENDQALDVLNGTRVRGPDEAVSKEVVQEITIDATPPVVEQVAALTRAVRGEQLRVQARCLDKESEVRDVFFYLGKPGPDGKMPPEAAKARATPVPDTELWRADCDLPADQKGPLDITVRATNAVGLETTAPPLSVVVVDPPPTAGTIRGIVYDKEAPVDNVRVRLYDGKGVLRRLVRTSAGGTFKFENLKDGEYRVMAKRDSTNTYAEAKVAVKDYKVMVKGKVREEPIELLLLPAGTAKKSRIAGVVVEGARPQAGLTVTLSDATSNKALLTTKTTAEGRYEFKDLAAGKYRVSATKSASRTKGQQTVDLKEGEDRSAVTIKLYR